MEPVHKFTMCICKKLYKIRDIIFKDRTGAFTINRDFYQKLTLRLNFHGRPETHYDSVTVYMLKPNKFFLKHLLSNKIYNVYHARVIVDGVLLVNLTYTVSKELY